MTRLAIILIPTALACLALWAYTRHAIPHGAPWPRTLGAGIALGGSIPLAAYAIAYLIAEGIA